MDAPAEISIRSKAWPPERGWPLFVAWMGGILAIRVITIIVVNILFWRFLGPGDELSVRILYAVTGIALYAWQAWLLFRKHPARFAFWALLPVPVLLLPQTEKTMQFASLILPVIGAGILRGVRLRAWAWILAGMAGVILSQSFYWFLYRMDGYEMVQRLVMRMLGDNSSEAMLAAGINGALQAVWLVTEAISAAVLAWKMPPVVPLSPGPEVKVVE